MSASADRLQAARVLLRVESGAYSTRLLGGESRPGVRARVLGVLRWQRTLDRSLAALIRRPLADLDPEVLVALRLGLHDGGLLGVPWPVAVDAAVHLVRRLGRSSAAGMVNAVLRRAPTELDRLRATGAPADRWSHPEWLVARWRAHFGDEAALDALEADQQPAGLWLWFRLDGGPPPGPPGTPGYEPHPWCPGAFRPVGGPGDAIGRLGGGDAYAQDPSSQLVAHLALAAAPQASTIVDLCAAPGGKAALMTQLRPSARVVALDRHLGRTRLVSAMLPGMVVAADATAPPIPPESMGVVLLDAPCSGSGTLRRHPELRWRLTPEAIAELAEVQSRLLESALRCVGQGGVLVYATCSIEPEENEELLVRTPRGFERIELETLLPPGCPSLPTAAGGVRILPRPEADGFTIHALRRRR